MNLSPTFLCYLTGIGLNLLKALFLSFGCGFILYLAIRYFHEAWKKKKHVKIWLSLSVGCFALYLLLVGLK